MFKSTLKYLKLLFSLRVRLVAVMELTVEVICCELKFEIGGVEVDTSELGFIDSIKVDTDCGVIWAKFEELLLVDWLTSNGKEETLVNLAFVVVVLGLEVLFAVLVVVKFERESLEVK